jgi:CHAT domain-containing protein
MLKLKTILFAIVVALTSGTLIAQTANEVVDVDSIKPPPRNIKDILSLVEQTKPDLLEVEKAQKIIALPIPVSSDPVVLNHFYSRRAIAYQFLGRMNLAIADMRIAVDQYPTSDPRLHMRDLTDLGVFESLGGKNTSATETFERALNWQREKLSNLNGLRLTTQRQIINSLSAAGNFDRARNELVQQENLLTTLRRVPAYQTNASTWETQYESARGIFFLYQGQWIESERSLRKAVNLLKADYKKVKVSSTRLNEMDQEYRVQSDTGSGRGLVTQQISRQLNLSLALLQQRKLIDSEYFAREATKLSLEVFGRNSTDTGRSLVALARVVNEQGRPAEAVLLAQAALSSLKEGGAAPDSLALAGARRSLGNALVSDKKYSQADKVFEEMAAGVKLDPVLAQGFKTEDLDWILAMLKTGKAQQAQMMAADLLSKTMKASGKESSELALIRAFEAISFQMQSKWTEANALYKVAIPVLINQARNDAENDSESVRQHQLMAFILESYLQDLAYNAKTDSSQSAFFAAQAFQIADIVRGSGVQRALTSSAARSNIKDPQLANLARQEQDLQRRINTLSELLTGLLSAAPDQQLPSVQAKIRTDLDTFKSQRETIKKEIEKKFPEYAELVDPKPATVERTQRLLKPDEVMVSWYFGDNVGYVWAISKDAPVQFIQIPIGRAQMAKEVAQLRKSLDPGVAMIEEIPAFDVALANQLYQQILAPVESSLKGKKVMLVVPHAELGQLPLSVLVTKVSAQPAKSGIPFSGHKNTPFLAKEIAVAQIPSVTALTALRSLPEGDANRKNFIGFGDPYFSSQQEKQGNKQKGTQLATRGIPLALRSAPKTAGVSSAELALLPRLPDTSLEIEEIAKVVGAGPDDIYLHKQASVKQVMSMDLSNRKVVMFSTHGLVPGELNGLTQPALALSSPDVTGDKDDGLLTMDKVISLKLNADWVVLSACNTAGGEGAGSEALSGLGRAFFFAGTKALLVSSWPVDSVASRQLMTDLFKRQQENKGLQKSEALRQAMLAQIDQGGVKEGSAMKYSYAHPLFWAPFVVVGD